MSNRITTAESEKCRQPGVMENLGATLGGKLHDSPLRGWLKSVYHGLLNLQTGGRGIVCSLPEGETVRVLPAYRHMSWNMHEYAAFKKALRPGGIALDVGANAGGYALLFGQWAGSDGSVFAFEPAPETFAGLCRHIEMNALGKIVIPVQAAASDISATAEFRAIGSHGMNRLVTSAEDAGGQSSIVEVPTVTLDEFCARENILPDLIKIDVEGFELAVLRGARETIKACGQRLSLFVELHPTTWREIGISKEEVIAELDRQGLEAVPLREHEDMWAVEGECMRIRVRQ
ncbi:MAG TPA: FkbM family methyltransferase [Pyrinomonadaceae bacterium]|jgi:FkbM family methyltransferase